MNETRISAVKNAVQMLGTKAILAKELGVTPAAVAQWMKSDSPDARDVPIKQCVKIEQLTDGRVIRKDLRPNDWQQIWPELATQTKAARQGGGPCR